MTVDTLQRVFKTLNDPTRIRILALLEREELAVSDLVQILGVGQSTVSRHLGILRESGLIRDRREGTFGFYRFVAPRDRSWRDAWSLAKRAATDDPLLAADAAALDGVLRERAVRTRSWFDALGPEWDSLRKIFDDDAHRARAITKLLPRDLVVADIGTGTGVLARDLARCGVRVVAVDHSERMLATAAQKLEAEGLDGVELRLGEATALPLADSEVDAALAHMVLHYLPSPAEAIREMARVVRPGGRVVIVDFVDDAADPARREWLETELGVLWHGFSVDALHEWLRAAGLRRISIEEHRSVGRGGSLPATFIASAHKSEKDHVA